MKQKILLVSLIAAIIATGLGTYSILYNSDKSLYLAFVSGLFGIASFFVGSVYPTDSEQIHVNNPEQLSSTITTKVI